MIYNYQCNTCGLFEKFRSYEDRKNDIECPFCSGKAHYVISAPRLKAWIDSDRWVKNREQVMKGEQKCLKDHGTYR